MNISKEPNESQELSNLVKTLGPELNAFRALVRDLSSIDSPYKSDFNHIKVLFKFESENIESSAKTMIQEFDVFSDLLEKIVEDDAYRDLYLNKGMLDSCISLKNNIENKLS